VKQWLPENRALPGDVWVDTILFDETRNYVRAVLSATLIYAWREAGAAPKPASLPADNLLALLGPVAPLNPPAPSATDTAQPVADTKAPPATQAKTMPASEPAAITVSADSP
ncbi:MAG: hypothetical protein B7X12_10075, partial [Halothiobacillus sp. 20-53-49]